MLTIVISASNMSAMESVCDISEWLKEHMKGLGKASPIINSESTNVTDDWMYGDHRESTHLFELCPSTDRSKAILAEPVMSLQ